MRRWQSQQKMVIGVALSVLVLGSLLSCGAGRGRFATPDTETGSLMHGGEERTYRLYLPADLEESAPLWVVLHGGGGQGLQVQRYSEVDNLAAREGFAVVYPDALKRHWNDGRNDPKRQGDVDDVGFLSALIAHLTETYQLDAKRVYMMGISNGGFMTERMMCERSELLAGAGNIVGGLSPQLMASCPKLADGAAGTVPLAIFKGTEDGLVPYDGGMVAKDRGEVVSTADELSFWRERNGCASAPSHTEERWDADANDAIHTTLTRYETGCEGAPVWHYRVEGGGHTWPGRAPKRRLVKRGGPHSVDIDANEELWRFFNRE